jgi:hypothetical protein
MSAVLSDYFLNIDSAGDRRARLDDAREAWDEDHPLDEVIDAALAYEILDLLLCDPSAAQTRLENELELEFQRQIEKAKEDEADAAFDHYISAQEDCW